MLSLVLNLLSQNAELLRSGDEGALLQFMKKVKETSIPALSWEILLPESESVEWCPALFWGFHDQEMLIYYSIFVQLNLILAPNQIIRD